MVQKIINHIVAAVNVPVREYDEYKNMIRYNGDGAKEDVLFHDAEFLDILSSCAEENVPMIYQEKYLLRRDQGKRQDLHYGACQY